MALKQADGAERAMVAGRFEGILCENLVKIYKVSTLEVVALQGLTLRVEPGEMLGIVGKSGSGKSTLLNILGGHDRPSAGTVRVAGHDLLRLGPRELNHYRRRTIGFIWQQTARNLLPYASARRNVEYVLHLAGISGRAARQRSDEVLAMVGLSERRHHKPADLSGGEQQRVAIAVALANRPRILLADEPTGELDNQTAADILNVLRELNEALKVTVVVVTHDAAIARSANRVVAIRDGRIATESLRAPVDQARPADDEATHVDYLVVDAAGRLQLPAEYVRALGINGRVRAHQDGQRIILERG
ncbi:MAG TPA: ABC transporter ATP-binding protein [Chloroflexota bacterium]|nr:ABC transporter ATP-binding protein [Chloroflexota bacterium]